MATLTPVKPPRPHIFNLPNQLTLSRFVLAIVLFVLIHYMQWAWCLVTFFLAAVTDYFDGYFARKHGITSTLGRNLDPLVDKVLIGGAYIFLLPLADAGLSPWIVTVVVARELIITSLRGFMEQRGAVFGADWLGKMKMGLQCAALFGIFTFLQVKQEMDPGGVRHFFEVVRDVLIYAMLAATALSGLQYLWRAALVLRTEE
jgi:CDP-diacylglycerol--glycerol-3-phosphate 3-phosphatidyltransferase